MNKSENIHRLFDGELSEEEQTLLEEAMAADPELAGELASIQSMAALHAESMPTPKDEFFIENEFLEIQKKFSHPLMWRLMRKSPPKLLPLPMYRMIR